MSNGPDQKSSPAAPDYKLAYLRGLFADPQSDPSTAWQEWLAQAEEATQRSDHTILAVLLGLLDRSAFALPLELQIEQSYFQGRLHQLDNEYIEAEQVYQTALPLLAQLSPDQRDYQRARFAIEISIGLIRQDKPDEAEAEARLAMDYVKVRQDKKLGWQACYAMSLVYHFHGDTEQSMACTEQALEWARACDDQRGIAITSSNLGMDYQSRDQWEEALQLLLEAVRLRRELGEQRALGPIYNALGNVYFSLRRYGEALESYNTALVLYQALNRNWSVGIAHSNIATVYNHLNQAEAGLDNALAAIHIFRDLDKNSLVAYNLAVAAYSLNMLGDVYLALKYVDEACDLLEKEVAQNMAGHLAETFQEIGRSLAALARDEADRRKAVSYYQQSLEKYEHIGGPCEIANLLRELGILTAQIPGETAASLSYIRRWWQLFPTLPEQERKFHLDSLFQFGQLLAQHRYAEEGLEIYRAAFGLLETSFNPPSVLELSQHYETASTLAVPAEAVPLLKQAVRLAKSGGATAAQQKRLSVSLDSLKKQLRKK